MDNTRVTRISLNFAQLRQSTRLGTDDFSTTKMPQVVKSIRGKEKLLDDLNYLYDFHKSSETKSYYRCENRMCTARVHTMKGDPHHDIAKRVGEHNHSATADRIAARVAVTELKVAAKSSQNSSRVLIANSAARLDEASRAQLPSVAFMSQSIRRWRKADERPPPVPVARNGFSIPEEFKTLESGEVFLQFDSGIDDPNRILIFATDLGLDDLEQIKQWAADGTFKSSPDVFYQIFTLHVQIGRFSVPRAFILLPGKTEAIYDRLVTALVHLRPNLQPDRIMMDFEKGAINSFEARFPGKCAIAE